MKVIPLSDARPEDVAKLLRAYRVAKKSKDLSTKNGSVLQAGERVLEGYNDIPKRIEDYPERRVRPLKYEAVVHAETSVIYEAARHGVRTAGSTLWVPWYACNHCALAIVSAGIARVVGHKNIFDINPRWDLSLAFKMLNEAGVECELIEGTLGAKAFMNGSWMEV